MARGASGLRVNPSKLGASGWRRKAAATSPRETRPSGRDGTLKFQLEFGGKKMFQNCGEGALNSIGTSEPSGFI